MKLKSFKTIQILYVVVSASALISACNTKLTEPLKLTPESYIGMNQTSVSANNAAIVENYGVPQTQSVQFSKNAEDALIDFTY